MTAPLLDARGLTVRFARHRGLTEILSGHASFHNAVDGIDLSVAQGEVLGVVGESGSGKTTLGKAILGLIKPSSGQIQFKGKDIAELRGRARKPVRQQMQMVFQDPLSSLNPRHSIRGALLTPLLNYGIGSAAEADRIIDAILAKVGLPAAMKHRYPHEMSGGQLQRIAIGRALIVSPSLIVADEPVSKLDVSVRAKILNLFKDVQQESGVALIFITHDLRVARYLCDRICVMYFGRIVESGPTRELFANPLHPYTRALVGTLKHGTPQAEPAASGKAGQSAAAGCRFYRHCSLRDELCRVQEPVLRPIGQNQLVACHKVRAQER